MEERWTRDEEGRKKKEGRLGRRKSGGIRFGLEAEERDPGYPGHPGYKKSVLESVSAGSRGVIWSRSWMKSYGETRDEDVHAIDRSSMDCCVLLTNSSLGIRGADSHGHRLCLHARPLDATLYSQMGGTPLRKDVMRPACTGIGR